MYCPGQSGGATPLTMAAAANRPVGAFLAESLQGCGGQIVLPDGYLAGAYAAVRNGVSNEDLENLRETTEYNEWIKAK